MQRAVCSLSLLPSAGINPLRCCPRLGFLCVYLCILVEMQLVVLPSLQKMPRIRRMSTSCCAWMAPGSLWTTTRPVTGPEWLLTPSWLGMTTRLKISGASSRKHRYPPAPLSFPCPPFPCPLVLLALSHFTSALECYWLILFLRWQSDFGVDTKSDFHLFGPPGKKDPVLKDLLFKDSAIMLKRVPSLMDSQLYLGFEYYSAIQSMRKGGNGLFQV